MGGKPIPKLAAPVQHNRPTRSTGQKLTKSKRTDKKPGNPEKAKNDQTQAEAEPETPVETPQTEAVVKTPKTVSIYSKMISLNIAVILLNHHPYNIYYKLIYII